MSDHPIDGLMSAAMSNIKDMVDVNTIIGKPISLQDGTTIIPISKVAFGFAAGGSEFSMGQDQRLPFGGGSGAGVTINPVGFLVASSEGVKFIAAGQGSVADKLVEYIPEAIEKLQDMTGKENKKERKYEGENGAVYVSEDIENL